MKYQFILNNKNYHSIEKMCKMLGVGCSSFYKWRKSGTSNREVENIILLKKIKNIYDRFKGRYGSRNIFKELKKEGLKIGYNRVFRLMQANGLKAKHKKRFRITTKNNMKIPSAPNLLKRRFNQSEKDLVWVSDITYLDTNEGWLYLSVIIDLYNREAIGWSIDHTLCTSGLIRAFNNACIKRNHPKWVLFHSDQGVQYRSNEFKDLLRKSLFIQSMSRKGNCWDNAVAESFFHSLKNDLKPKWSTREEAKLDVFEWIETYYNSIRNHSALGYVSPIEFLKTA